MLSEKENPSTNSVLTIDLIIWHRNEQGV